MSFELPTCLIFFAVLGLIKVSILAAVWGGVYDTLWEVRVPHVGTHDSIADTHIVVSSVLRLHTRGVKCQKNG